MTETVITVTSGPQAQSQARPAADLGWIQFNINYFLTYPGILKVIQLVRINSWCGRKKSVAHQTLWSLGIELGQRIPGSAIIIISGCGD